jgi:hypothetical protein
VFVSRRPPPFTPQQLSAAVGASTNWSEVLRHLGLRVGGNNHRTVQRYAREWEISTNHFDPAIAKRRAALGRGVPLEEVMVEGSTYSRRMLKTRLFRAGLKPRACEMCGQGEQWQGRRMSLILDHVNGVPDDNRLENLRIVCPNCAATLETHCGRNSAPPEPRECLVCAQLFVPRYPQHRYCSAACVGAANGDRTRGVPQPHRRKVERPSYEVLMAELAESSFLAVARRYGVSDNTIRKWVRWYERRPDL